MKYDDSKCLCIVLILHTTKYSTSGSLKFLGITSAPAAASGSLETEQLYIEGDHRHASNGRHGLEQQHGLHLEKKLGVKPLQRTSAQHVHREKKEALFFWCFGRRVLPAGAAPVSGPAINRVS